MPVGQKAGHIVTDRDRALFLTLWKWKVSTTAALAEEFFGSAYSDAAHRRLSKLTQLGYLRSVTLSSPSEFAWALEKRGFQAIRRLLYQLQEEGFRPEFIEHDFLCTLTQRGPWLSNVPAGMEHFSEQELRYFAREHFPSWAPHSLVHRPDGYSRVLLLGKPIVVAFEIELHRKKSTEYKRIAHFYSQLGTVYRVIWVVTSLAQAKWIRSVICSATPSDHSLHAFLIDSDLRKNCWDAKIVVGREVGFPLAHLLCRGLSPGYRPGDGPSICNTHKRPYRSLAYRRPTDHPFCNLMAISAIPSTPSLEAPPPNILSLTTHQIPPVIQEEKDHE